MNKIISQFLTKRASGKLSACFKNIIVYYYINLKISE